MLVGTDSALPAVLPGAAYHQELLFLHEAGIPTHELLLRATVLSARLFAPQPNFGSLEPGKRADVLVLGGDPHHDLNQLRNIDRVYLAGREIRRR